VNNRVPALQNWRKGNNNMRPVVFSQFEVCGILSSLQCFDTVGWVTGWASGLQKKTCCDYRQRFWGLSHTWRSNCRKEG